MAIFQSDINIVTPTSSKCYLLFDDISNYATNTQTSHEQQDFTDYYRITITRPDNSTYVYDAISGGDVTISPASSAIFSGTYPFLPTDTNGTYKVRVCVVPTWDNTETYNLSDNDVVFYNGYLWAATTNGVTSTPAFGNTDWANIPDETTLIANHPKYCTEKSVSVNCLPEINYQSSLVDVMNGLIDVDSNSDCSALVIEDNTNYATNTEAGHNISNFTDYRKITILKPNGQIFVYSSLGDGDDTVSSPSSGNNTVTHFFDDKDVDGIYEIRLCSYPTWDSSASYSLGANPIIVYYNGSLYKALTNSTNAQPDISTTEWELYEPTEEEELKTRYCTIAKIVILCISINKCYEQKIHEAFCLVSTDFCNDDVLCRNKKFLNAVKMRVIMDAMEYSVNRQAWNEVEEQVNLLKTLCSC